MTNASRPWLFKEEKHYFMEADNFPGVVEEVLTGTIDSINEPGFDLVADHVEVVTARVEPLRVILGSGETTTTLTQILETAGQTIEPESSVPEKSAKGMYVRVFISLFIDSRYLYCNMRIKYQMRIRCANSGIIHIILK